MKEDVGPKMDGPSKSVTRDRPFSIVKTVHVYQNQHLNCKQVGWVPLDLILF